ncbi:TPA: hypothetical protein ACH3X1_000345 [Trebouxia sp. C0004]
MPKGCVCILQGLQARTFYSSGNTVDLGSFMWAHCLVQSKAISLPSSIQAGPSSRSSAGSADQCGGPCLVDMCNHKGQGGSAHLVWGQQHLGHRTVKLVAKQHHHPGVWLPSSAAYGLPVWFCARSWN